MPLFEPELLSIFIITLTILIFGSFITIGILYSRINKLTRGASGSFEHVVRDIQSTLSDYQNFKKEIIRSQQFLDEKTSRIKGGSDCHNFKDSDGLGGGKNSFVTAFINDHGDGFLLSTIDTRERVNIFAKPISGWVSERSLSEEEQAVLTKLKK